MTDFCAAEDERRIRDLIGMSAYLTDLGDLEEFEAILGGDVVWEMPDGRIEGLQPVLRSMRERRESKVTGPDSHARHLVRTLFVRRSASDQWQAESMWLFLIGTDGAPRIAAAGEYRDRFVRDAAGRIRFAHRISTTG